MQPVCTALRPAAPAPPAHASGTTELPAAAPLRGRRHAVSALSALGVGALLAAAPRVIGAEADPYATDDDDAPGAADARCAAPRAARLRGPDRVRCAALRSVKLQPAWPQTSPPRPPSAAGWLAQSPTASVRLKLGASVVASPVALRQVPCMRSRAAEHVAAGAGHGAGDGGVGRRLRRCGGARAAAAHARRRRR
jgi:hypothetical protein